MAATDGGQNVDQNMNDYSPKVCQDIPSHIIVIVTFIALINTSSLGFLFICVPFPCSFHCMFPDLNQ